jgi:hypothetical protein
MKMYILKSLITVLAFVPMCFGIATYISNNQTSSQISQAAVPVTRDMYQWPFSSGSIWNMPIGSNAVYATANMPAPDTYAGDEHHIYKLTNPKPTQFETGTLPLDDGMISDIPASDSTNRIATVIDNNGDFYQLQPATRTTATSNVTGYLRYPADSTYANLVTEGRGCIKIVAEACYQNLKGNGIDGPHWGSGLSGIGGGLKSGDLTSTEDIRHALNIEVSGWKYLKCNNSDTSFSDFKAYGFMWPADRNDEYGCGVNGYGGNLDYFRMGALLALKPNLDINTLNLQTDAAKKIAKAFQNYGGYVTDDAYGLNSNSTIFNFTYEKEVAAEFKAKYGHDFNIFWDTGSVRQSPFFKDMDKIITQLNVITNNTPTTIGGGGVPRAALAPDFANNSAINLNIKANLQGSYNVSTSNMNNGLKTRNLLPAAQPYNVSPFNYAGTETKTTFAVDDVDWVLVELRQSGVLKATQAAVLKQNGALDLSFTTIPAGSYDIRVRHRNHLAISTATSVMLNTGSNSIDFTANTNVRNSNQVLLKTGVYGLKRGNVNGDNGLNATDRNTVKSLPDALGVYSKFDVNMNGDITSTDRLIEKGVVDAIE